MLLSGVAVGIAILHLFMSFTMRDSVFVLQYIASRDA